ncbi:hypothetical protein ACH5RR_006260 [Cinchona calisaya]|uniref:Uncharacterized protein n=1 Tax=Cinchona calisaya TaxID=153742 RepID=A0ABD3ANI4_9GENT
MSFPTLSDCPHCGAKKFVHKTANFCCSNCDITLASNKIPYVIKELLTSSSEEAKTFRTYIITYNNYLAFSSLGIKFDQNLAKRNKGIYTFRIQGQVYHFINDLAPKEGYSNNLQFYFHNTDHKLLNRLQACPRLKESVLSKLMAILDNNPYANFFRSLNTVENLDNYQIFLHTRPEVDQRVYNKLTIS